MLAFHNGRLFIYSRPQWRNSEIHFDLLSLCVMWIRGNPSGNPNCCRLWPQKLKSCKVCSLQSNLQSSWIKYFELLESTINPWLPLHSYRNNCFAATLPSTWIIWKSGLFFFLFSFITQKAIRCPQHIISEATKLPFKRRLKDRIGTMTEFSPIMDNTDYINFPWQNYCNINLNEWWWCL